MELVYYCRKNVKVDIPECVLKSTMSNKGGKGLDCPEKYSDRLVKPRDFCY